MRKILAILLCLTLMPISFASAEKISSIQLTGGQLSFEYSFDCQEEYVVLHFSTPKEKGKLTLYSENGHFEGKCPLQCTFEESKVTVKIENLRQRPLGQETAMILSSPNEQTAAARNENIQQCRKVRDLVCEPVNGGVKFQFTAPGHEKVILKYRSSQQRGEFVLSAGENYTYQGETELLYTYPGSTVIVEVYNLKGSSEMAECQTKRGYKLTAMETEPKPGRLTGVTVCIDAGHQGVHHTATEPLGPGLQGKVTSSGGMARGNVTRRMESMVVLEVAFLLRDELLRQGAQVVMTRETEDTWLSNLDRCNAAEEGGADFMLRLHCDTRGNEKAKGISVYCPLNSDYARAVAPYKEYKMMAEMLMNGMKTAVGYELKTSTGRTSFSDKYVGNNWAKMPCFLVELGFMSNPEEDLLLSHPHYQQLLAEGMAQGIYDMAVLRGLTEE